MISGFFTSKRGICYNYNIYSDGCMEMWKRVTVGKSTGGYRQKDIMVRPTKEALEHASKVHNIKTWCY